MKKKTSNPWLKKQKKDVFFRESKIQGYRSRSAFKLIEMNKKFNFLKRDSLLLDLGSYPGGWSQVSSNEIKKGKILAVDIKNMESVKSVYFLKGDFCENIINKQIMLYFNRKIDVVLSDMAVNTTGNKQLDSYNTGQLCIKAMDLAKQMLSKDGVFISKIFMGEIYKEINEKANKYFKKVIKFKPKASKKESKEIYIYCKGM